MELELVVRGGTLVDGGGGPPRRADVGVRGGEVVAKGDLGAVPAALALDAAGALVTPGFVDVHTHHDLCLGWEGLSGHSLRQGVTTVVAGNCGLGDPDVAATLARAAAARLGFHLAQLAPLGPLRSRVIPRSEGRPARPDEVEGLGREVARALEAGAVGLSWGPYHENLLVGSDELRVALAEVARRGRTFAIHRRCEGPDGLAATCEALGQARAAGARLQVSHLKAAGRAHWDGFAAVVERLEAARGEQDVAVDVYPYDASLTYLSAPLPGELKADGGLVARLRTPAGREAALRAAEAWFAARQGPEQVVLLEPARPEVPPGTTLAAAAALLGAPDAAHALVALIEADPAGTGGWAAYRHMMAAAQVEQVLDLPWAAVASDAVPLHEGTGQVPHPRAYATFARAVTRALARGPAALADTVRRATAFPAARFGLRRGLLAPGWPADLLVLRDLVDRASYEAPARYPDGIAAVVVEGRLALRDGVPTGVRAGRVLRGG